MKTYVLAESLHTMRKELRYDFGINPDCPHLRYVAEPHRLRGLRHCAIILLPSFCHSPQRFECTPMLNLILGRNIADIEIHDLRYS